ncbi:cell wall-binding repeat-containing protein [Peptostreptococcus sp. D1]|uniref:cell wall-binding repeat-containing protein n=1 Tax=Peptostreptococcus sp. D1 TaxID=72304 RepID=UPI0008E9BEE2|nr:cell wall-binding repeat-containing protein [Peptostreptococcus sp. D1]SFE85808.1 Putative cell wall-binding protein [Peptostreptococcus sp. D1]
MKNKNFVYVAMATTVSAASVLGSSTKVSSAEGLSNVLIIFTNNGMPLMEPILFEIRSEGKLIESDIISEGMLFRELDPKKAYTIKVSNDDKKWTSKEYEVTFKADELNGTIPVIKEVGSNIFLDSANPIIEVTKKESKADVEANIAVNLGENVSSTDKDKKNSTPKENAMNKEMYLDSFKIKILKNNTPMTDAKLSFSKMEKLRTGMEIASIIEQNIAVDNNGEHIFSNSSMLPNTTYEIRLNSKNIKLDRESVRFSTDSNKKIIAIDDKKITDISQGIFVFNAVDKNDTSLKTVRFNQLDVKDKDGKSLEGVEITANTISPNLASYKNVKSDKNGKLAFELEGSPEGRFYTLCVSKNAQFEWEFKPDSIDIIVYSNGNVDVLKSNNNPDTSKTFVVKKNDVTYLKKEFKDKIEQAKKLINSPSYTEASKITLKNALTASEEEAAKPETTPFYVKIFINHLDEGIKALVKVNNSISMDSKKPDIKSNRIGGSDRIETSILLSKQKFTNAETVIIASANNFPDALSASALANKYKAPILLANHDKISKSVLDELKRLGAKSAIIVGGESSISENAVNSIKSSVNVERLAGNNRYETSRKIAEKLMNNGLDKALILVDGRNYPDALSSSALIHKASAPILLVSNAAEAKENIEFVKKLNRLPKIIVGGTNSVGKDIESKFSNTTRISGSDRYETSRKIANMTLSKGSNIYLSTGRNYADAIASGGVIALEKSSLVLVDENSRNVSSIKNKFEPKSITAIGGVNSISNKLLMDLIK